MTHMDNEATGAVPGDAAPEGDVAKPEAAVVAAAGPAPADNDAILTGLHGKVDADLVRAIEAIVLVATEPVDPGMLAQLLEVPLATVHSLCERLAAAYEDAGHGFMLVKVAGGYRYQTHPDVAPYVERFVLDGQRARMSAAALETLAIVAYKQPISRAQIASIRGVDPDGVLRTLQARGYIDQVGKDPGPGQAVLWGTTGEFLEKLGLNSVFDLPSIAGFVPGADVVEALEHGLRVPTRVEPIAPPAGPTPLARLRHHHGEQPLTITSNDEVLDEDAGESGDEAVDLADDELVADEAITVAEDDGPASDDESELDDQSDDEPDDADEDIDVPDTDESTDLDG
jgi:segregation and condensation protein B